MSVRDRFHAFAHATASAVGSPYAFVAALAIVIAWAATGPAFHYSDTWQLIINTGTTVVTFLMVFMIQSTQNRDSRAIHLKLDELIRAIESARNRLVDIEDMSDEELARLAREFERLRDEPDQADQPDPDQPAAPDRQADHTERPPARGGARAHPGTKHRAAPPASRAGSLRTVAHRTRNRSK